MVNGKYEPDFPTEIVHEGKVQVLVPKLEAYGVVPQDYAPSRAPVFYNPIMEFNRDLTVLAFQAYQRWIGREISICEPLTSQGVRGIRFAAEIEGVKSVLIGDINMRAYRMAKHNVSLNGLEKVISVKHREASCLLTCNSAPKKRFDIVDIDPFGTPSPHLDSAVQAIRNNGLLASTATDLAPLCGVHSKACLRKYGGKPLRTEYCHELALRLLAGCTTSAAARHEIGIQVLFSHSSEHYIRLYTKIAYGAGKADESIKNLGYILHCFNCLHREMVSRILDGLVCPECGSKMDWAGPLWIGSLWNTNFIAAMMAENRTVAFKNSARITKLLNLTNDESAGPPTYYVTDKISGKLGLPSQSIQSYIGGLRKNGFSAEPTHFNPRGIRTNATASEMREIMQKSNETA